jgi:hypothetical protein
MWARNVREVCLNADFHVTFRNLLRAVKLRHGTDGFISPPKEGVLRIFFRPKNPTASVGCEPANLSTKGQHPTSRPPKPLNLQVTSDRNSVFLFGCFKPRRSPSTFTISKSRVSCVVFEKSAVVAYLLHPSEGIVGNQRNLH